MPASLLSMSTMLTGSCACIGLIRIQYPHDCGIQNIFYDKVFYNNLINQEIVIPSWF